MELLSVYRVVVCDARPIIVTREGNVASGSPLDPIASRAQAPVDLLVILVVATVAIAANLVAAMGIGIAVAVLSFLARMSKSLVRRAYHGDAVHSRGHTRSAAHGDPPGPRPEDPGPRARGTDLLRHGRGSGQCVDAS